MNDNIVPYVPIAPRVQAKNEKSRQICQNFFKLIDEVTSAQICFNHQTQKGLLSISPDQINDLIQEISKSNQSYKAIEIKQLKHSLKDLIYPKFSGELTITSPIWNQTEVKVWQFQLNQIANGVNMETLNTELLLDQTISSIRIWRNSLEAAGNDKQVTYQNNDLIYKLMAIEDKLEKIQNQLD